MILRAYLPFLFVAFTLSCGPKSGAGSGLPHKGEGGWISRTVRATTLKEALRKGKLDALKAHKEWLRERLEELTSRKILFSDRLDPERHTGPFFRLVERLDLPCRLVGEDEEGDLKIAKLTCARRTAFEEALLKELQPFLTGLPSGRRIFFPPPVDRAGKVTPYGLMVRGLLQTHLDRALRKKGSLLVEYRHDLKGYLNLLTMAEKGRPFLFSHLVYSSYEPRGGRVRWRFKVVDLAQGKRIKQIVVTLDTLPGGNPGVGRVLPMAAVGDGTPLDPAEAVARCAKGSKEQCISAFLQATPYTATKAQRRALYPALDRLCLVHNVKVACELRADVLHEGMWGVSITPQVVKELKEQCFSGQGSICKLLLSTPGKYGLDDAFCSKMLAAHTPLLGKNLVVTILAIEGYRTNSFCYMQNAKKRNSLISALLQIKPKSDYEWIAYKASVAYLKQEGLFFPKERNTIGRLGLRLAQTGVSMVDSFWGSITVEQGKKSCFGSLAKLLEHGCDSGSSSACSALGSAVAKGYHPQYGKGRAMGFLQKACRMGNGKACFSLYGSIDLKKADKEERALAVSYLNRGCRAGDQESCEELYVAHIKLGLKGVDFKTPNAFFRSKCKIREARGCALDALAHFVGFGYPRDPQKGMALFSSRCDANPAVCTLLGGWKIIGQLLERDEKGAGIWLDRGCTRSNPDGCFFSARFLMNKKNKVLYNLEKGQKQLQLACDYDSALGCFALGDDLFQRMETKKMPLDGPRVFSLFTKGCQLQEQFSCTALGALYMTGFNGKLPNNPVLAERFLSKSCSMGSKQGCFFLAEMFLSGVEGVPQNIPRAEAAAKRGCVFGEGSACLLLVKLYTTNRDYIDKKRATEYALHACGFGEEEGCILGAELISRKNVSPSVVDKWATLAVRVCNKGSLPVCSTVGAFLLSGRAGDKNIPKGIEILKFTCSQGEAVGCYTVGIVLSKGVKGHPADPEAALAYLQRACKLKHKQACFILNVVKKALEKAGQ